MNRRPQFRFIATLIACATVPMNASDIHFTEVARESGVDLTMTCGATPSRHILDVNGGGVATFDFDNDGDLDLFFANGATIDNPEKGPGSRLYANDGAGKFTDVSEKYGIDISHWAMGVAIGDIDNDGFDDIFVTCYGPNILLKNDTQKPGVGKFIDISEQAAVDDDRWATSAAFGDIDADGDLDLYVVNYLEFDPRKPPSREGIKYKGVSVMAGPHGLKPQQDILYENQGNGTFKNITQNTGCLVDQPGYGLVALMLDFNRDGKQDIFVGNDSTENFLFQNRGDNTFDEIGQLSGIASNMDGSNQATMGIAISDIDGNGLPDSIVTSFSSDTNTLHLNIGDGFFEDRTAQFGLGLITRPFLNWACAFYDFDHDGDEDLFMSAGHVYPEAATTQIDSDYEQPQLIFKRRDSTRFERVINAGTITTEKIRGRSAAFGDIDNDGDIDIVLTQLNGPVKIYRNNTANRNALSVELRQNSRNHRAYGSTIELTIGDQRKIRWIHGGGSYQSFTAPVAHFGLGLKPPKTAALKITWPDGTAESFENISTSGIVTITRGQKNVTIRPFKK